MNVEYILEFRTKFLPTHLNDRRVSWSMSNAYEYSWRRMSLDYLHTYRNDKQHTNTHRTGVLCASVI